MKYNYVLTVFISPITIHNQSADVSEALAIHVEEEEIKGLMYKGTASQSVLILNFQSDATPAMIRKTLHDAHIPFILAKGNNVSLPKDTVDYFANTTEESDTLTGRYYPGLNEKPLEEQLKVALEKEDYEEAARIRNKINRNK